MHNRLAANLMRYSIEHTTESAGSRRKKRGNGDVWLLCAVLLSVSAAVAVLM